jgi:hypothetical protein
MRDFVEWHPQLNLSGMSHPRHNQLSVHGQQQPLDEPEPLEPDLLGREVFCNVDWKLF